MREWERTSTKKKPTNIWWFFFLLNHKPNYQREEMLESTKPLKEFSMSLALIQNFWGDGGEELTKMQIPRSNHQRFWLQVYGWAQDSSFSPDPQEVQVVYGQHFEKHCLEHIHLIFNYKNSKLWLATYALIKGEKALSMYFLVPISVCTYMELHFENFKSPFKI